MPHTSGRFSSVFLRCALGLGFLSAVADRFGLWGAFGQPNVEWGNFGAVAAIFSRTVMLGRLALSSWSRLVQP